MIVEIPIPTGSLAGSLANMRNWLDRNRCTPARFETQSVEPGIVLIRVEFADDQDAERFRSAFGGDSPGVAGAAA